MNNNIENTKWWQPSNEKFFKKYTTVKREVIQKKMKVKTFGEIPIKAAGEDANSVKKKMQTAPTEKYVIIVFFLIGSSIALISITIYLMIKIMHWEKFGEEAFLFFLILLFPMGMGIDTLLDKIKEWKKTIKKY